MPEPFRENDVVSFGAGLPQVTLATSLTPETPHLFLYLLGPSEHTALTLPTQSLPRWPFSAQIHLFSCQTQPPPRLESSDRNSLH